MSTPFDPRPIVLEGDRVRLEPLDLEHAVALFEAGSDAAIWAVRDTVYYSIIDTEWPEVKARLRALVVRNHR